MNTFAKLFSFIFIFLLVVGAVSAIQVYENWEDGSTNNRVYEQGDVFLFNYTTLAYGHETSTTEIFLLKNLDLINPIALLENRTETGSYYGDISYDTQNLENGDYTLFAKATSELTGLVGFDFLNFTIENETQNTAPEWSDDLQLDYSYNINLGQVSVVNLSNYVLDAENDDITFILDDSSTNQSVVDCWLASGDTLTCNLEGTGTTTLAVTAFDGELYSEAAIITINVWEENPQNTAPYWNDGMQLYYKYDLSENQVTVLDLADVAIDDENDQLLYSLNQSNTDLNIVNCWLTDTSSTENSKSKKSLFDTFKSLFTTPNINNDDARTGSSPTEDSILKCDLNAVGLTTLDAFAFDGQLFSLPASITINVTEDITSNEPPYFYNINNIYLTSWGVNDIFDFDLHTADPDNDALTYAFYGSSNTNVISNCAIIDEHILRCVAVGNGDAQLNVSVADEFHTPVYESLAIKVKDSGSANTAPYWDDFNAQYSYYLGLGQVQVLKLDDVINDAENDSLTFSLDQSNTNLNVVDCSLVGSSVTEFGSDTGTSIRNDGSSSISSNIISSIKSILGVNTVSSPSLSNGVSDPVNITTGTYLVCNLNAVGLTTVDVYANDGQLSSDALTVTIKVWDNSTNNTAPYYNDINTFFSYYLGLDNVDVLVLDDVFYDNEADNLTYILDDSMTDPAVATCGILVDSTLHCDLVGVGITKMQLYAFDGEYYSQALTVTINVWDNSTNNTAPYWNDSLQLDYIYNINLQEVDVVNLADYAIDDENDSLTFTLEDVSPTVPVTNCELLDESLVHCQLQQLGTSYLEARVSDGQFETPITLTIHVVNETTDYDSPVAVITAPSTVHPDELIYFDGYASYSDPALSIVSYNWVMTSPSGQLTYFDGPLQYYTFDADGLYYLKLTVTDSIGQTASTVHTFTVLVGGNGDDGRVSPEQGLKINSYSVYGNDFETACVGGDLDIFATVENIAGEDLKGIRMIFTIPEFGIRMKSNAFDLDVGEQTTVSILGFVPECVEPGVYYPYYEFSDNKIRRVKAGYLEITG